MLKSRRYFWIHFYILLFYIGFNHEHVRPDRDDYVSVVPIDTRPNACNNYNSNKLKADEINDMGVTYDYCSVLHYSRGWSCKITPLNPVSCNIKGQTATDIGQRIGLSEKDKIEINKRYNCQTSGDFSFPIPWKGAKTNQIEQYWQNF